MKSLSALFSLLMLVGIAQAGSAREDLERSLNELGALQSSITDERVPLSDQMSSLEGEVRAIRESLEEEQNRERVMQSEIRDLEASLDVLKKELSFVNRNALDYALYFETRLHIGELPLYENAIQRAKEPEGGLDLLNVSLNRIEEQLGGTDFAGTALSKNGEVITGAFLQKGPMVWFSGDDGTTVGRAIQEVNSIEPVVLEMGDEGKPLIAALVSAGSGEIPVDVTGGKAYQVDETRDTLSSHVQKGGFVMIPILMLAIGAMLVAIWKWVEMLRMKAAGVAEVQQVVAQVNRGDKEGATALANKIKGPVGRMLQVGIRHADRSKELLEELLYEQVVQERPKLERRLPFIQLAAAIAPLLGLLGTVTGMIHTFKMIIVFGTGDAKTLSTGISEALITTEFGLVIAVGALLIHAFLTRQVKAVMASMEHIAISFVNGLSIGKEEIRG